MILINFFSWTKNLETRLEHNHVSREGRSASGTDNLSRMKFCHKHLITFSSTRVK